MSHRAPRCGPGAGLGLVASLRGCVCNGAVPSAGAVPGGVRSLARVCQPLCRGILAVPASPALEHEAWSCAWAEHHPGHALTAPTSHTAASQQCSIAKRAGRGWVWTWSLPVASLQLLIPAPKLPWTSLKWLLLMNPTAWSLGGSLTLHPNSKSPVFGGGSRSSPFPAGPTRTPAIVQPAISSSSHRVQDLCCCFRARLESHTSGDVSALAVNEPISNRSGRASVPSASAAPLAHPARGGSKRGGSPARHKQRALTPTQPSHYYI